MILSLFHTVLGSIDGAPLWPQMKVDTVMVTFISLDQHQQTHFITHSSLFLNFLRSSACGARLSFAIQRWEWHSRVSHGQLLSLLPVAADQHPPDQLLSHVR